MSLGPSVFRVENNTFNKDIEVPSSKSYANRLLILASIDKEDILIKNIPLSSDVLTMIKCLQQIGLDIEVETEGVWVKGSFPECEKNKGCQLFTGDGGTTNRFLIPLLARGKLEYEIIPEGHMKARPMEPLVKGLLDLGCKVSYRENYKDENIWFKVKGPYVESKEIEVDCTQSTQFITGLALATLDLDINVKSLHLGASLSYWSLTQDLMDKFKAKKLNYENPVDFSGLTYPLALAAVTGSVTIKNALDLDPFQADSLFIDILKEMGADIYFSQKGLVCNKSELHAIELDGSQCPDAIATVLYVCAFAKGKSRIFNLEVLTHKECNRFEEIIRIMKSFGIEVEVKQEEYEIIVYGNSYQNKEIELVPQRDHRMIMISYLFMRTIKGGILHNYECVEKSFSNFFEVMEN